METFKLNNKTIIIFSSQGWGEMLLSKHHYAINLAKMGNTVYFINPPQNHFKKVTITPINDIANLFVVDSGIWNIQRFRFHSSTIFKFLVNINLKRIKKTINSRIDVVWNFDFFGYCNYSLFNHSLKIAHPVDFVPLKKQPYFIKGADIVFSVAHEILDEFKSYNIPSYFINHSINEEIIKPINSSSVVSEGKRLKTGYIGNLLRPDIDHKILINLIKQNPEIEFIFIGNYTASNIGGDLSDEANTFIKALKKAKNVTLKGILTQSSLHQEMNAMDLFLICYNKEKDFCKGTNYHKVMEYIATGKVTVSNHITTYSSTKLFEMCNSNDEMETLFNTVTKNINTYNSAPKINERIAFAKENTYINNIKRIEKRILELSNN